VWDALVSGTGKSYVEDREEDEDSDRESASASSKSVAFARFSWRSRASTSKSSVISVGRGGRLTCARSSSVDGVK